MTYRFEWNFNINNQEEFEQFKKDMLKEDNPYLKLPFNYEQMARLFYKHDNGECVMVELQVPTYEYMKLCEYTEDECAPWLESYEVNSLEDYDCSDEIGIEYDVELSFDNAEIQMLEFAKEMFN